MSACALPRAAKFAYLPFSSLPLLRQVVYPALRDVLGDLTPDHLLAKHQGEAAGTAAAAAVLHVAACGDSACQQC
jgi:hypothetical protein